MLHHVTQLSEKQEQVENAAKQSKVRMENPVNVGCTASVGYLSSVMVCVRVVFRKTVITVDWCFDYLSTGSHLQSQVKNHQMMLFVPLVIVVIDQFSSNVIGHQDLKVTIIGFCFIVTFGPSIVC